jgi:DNA-binding transcriptional LysR family regulator
MDSLGHLRQLVALAETGNFRKAGQKLGISHSAVSQTIKRLEGEYGTELFDRTRFDGSRNETVPTALGERIVAAARIAINEMEAAARDVQMLRDRPDSRRELVGPGNGPPHQLAPKLAL